MVSVASHHAEWLSLVDVSGPFLSVPVLKEALPNGLDAHDPRVAAEVRAALEQWADPECGGLGSVDEVEVHLAFVRFVLHEVLGFDDRFFEEVAHGLHEGVSAADVVVDGDGVVRLVTK